MSYLLRDDLAIYYEAHGDGPAVLLTHSFAATGRMWTPQILMLESNFRVVVWDMRGHGRTDSPIDPESYSEDAALEDMVAILDVLGIQQAIVGGHSLGGYLSLAFHAKFPDRVAALLLSGTGPGYRKAGPREEWNARVNMIADDVETGGLAGMTVRSSEVDRTDHKSADGLVKAARGMLTQRDGSVMESLATIAVPTWISVGSNDLGFLKSTEYLEAKIPGSVRTVFEGAGHSPSYEVPDEFNAALVSFLDSHSDAFMS